MKPQKTQNCQNNPEKKKNKTGGIIHRYLRLYYRDATIKTTWYWRKTDTQISGTEQGAEKETQASTVN